MISPTKAPQMRDAVLSQEVLVLWFEDVLARRDEDIQLEASHDLLHGENLREVMSHAVHLPHVRALNWVLRAPTRFTKKCSTRVLLKNVENQMLANKSRKCARRKVVLRLLADKGKKCARHKVGSSQIQLLATRA